MRTHFRGRETGAALLLALWALFLLSAVVISWALDIDARLTLNGNANRVMEAEAMAASGSEIAMHPRVQPGSPLLRGGLARTQTFEARITGEGGRLNLNWLVAGENDERLKLLRKYLETKGIELNDRDHMIDCLLDWVDPDNLVRLNGAEAEDDYRPNNTLLARIDDVKRIRGWEDFTSNVGWDDDLTLEQTAGPVDLAWASREVLLTLPGMTNEIVDQFLDLRRGPDGADGTEDDPFDRIDDAYIALGLGIEQRKALLTLVNFNDPVVRVVSVGKSANVTRVVRMVIRKNPNTGPQLLSWKEL